jgi:hypothetical protein
MSVGTLGCGAAEAQHIHIYIQEEHLLRINLRQLDLAVLIPC